MNHERREGGSLAKPREAGPSSQLEARLLRLPGERRGECRRLLSEVGTRLGFDHSTFPWAGYGADLVHELPDMLSSTGMDPERIGACVGAAIRVSLPPADEEQWLPARPRPTALSRQEFAALFAVCARDTTLRGVRDTALLAALYAGPLTPKDVCHLRAEDHPRDLPGLLARSRGPRCPERRIPLGPLAREAILRWTAVRPPTAVGPLFLPVVGGGETRGAALHPMSVVAILRRRASQCGVASVRPRNLRRASILGMLLAGAPPAAIVRRLVGSKEDLDPASGEGTPGASASGVGRHRAPVPAPFHAW